MKKKCKTCGEEKPLAEFYKNGIQGRQPNCRDCFKIKLLARKPPRQKPNLDGMIVTKAALSEHYDVCWDIIGRWIAIYGHPKPVRTTRPGRCFVWKEADVRAWSEQNQELIQKYRRQPRAV